MNVVIDKGRDGEMTFSQVVQAAANVLLYTRGTHLRLSSLSQPLFFGWLPNSINCKSQRSTRSYRVTP